MGSTRNWITNPPGQRANWQSIERTKEGHVVRTKAHQIVTRMTRFGKKIQLHQLSTVPKNATERALLEEIKRKISQEKSGKSSSKKLAHLEAAKRVLTTSLQLRTHLGRDPHIYHILATTGLIYGFNSAEIDSASRHIITTHTAKRPRTWEGNANKIRVALRTIIDSQGNNYVTGTEKQLFLAKVPLPSKSLAEKIGLQWNIANSEYLNCTLQLLETAGLVKKMPPIVDASTQHTLSVWVHRDHQLTIKTYEFGADTNKHFLSVPMELLNQLYKRPRLFTELHREKKIHQKKITYIVGNKDAIFERNNVLDNITHLKTAGLILVKKVHPTQTTMGGASSVTEVEITKLGKELWNHTIKTGILSERLRILLLGEKEK